MSIPKSRSSNSAFCPSNANVAPAMNICSCINSFELTSASMKEITGVYILLTFQPNLSHCKKLSACPLYLQFQTETQLSTKSAFFIANDNSILHWSSPLGFQNHITWSTAQKVFPPLLYTMHWQINTEQLPSCRPSLSLVLIMEQLATGHHRMQHTITVPSWIENIFYSHSLIHLLHFCCDLRFYLWS